MEHIGGRAQFNQVALAGYTDIPFINVCKTATSAFGALNATNDWRLLRDSRGYPTQMPTGSGAKWEVGIYLYGSVNDVWVLDWPGTASLTLSAIAEGFSISESVISANRKEYTITADAPALYDDHGIFYYMFGRLCFLDITSMSANTFAGGQIRLYPKTLESLLNSVEIFHPDFIDRVRKFGAQRYLDWMLLFGQYNNEALPSHARSVDAFYYGGEFIDSTLWCGASTGTNDQVVSQPSATIASWTDGQAVSWLMTDKPTYQTITGCTNAADGVFALTSHGFSNGEKVEFNPSFVGGAWQAMTATGNHGFKTYTVTVVDVDHFKLGINTTTFGTYPGGMRIYKQITLKVGSLDAVPCARLISAENFFVSSEFTPGQELTAVYNATFGRMLMAGDATLGIRSSVPVEIMVALANKCRSHPWFTFGPLWTDAKITAFVTYVRDNLNSGLIPRYEWANECWNYWVTWYIAMISYVADPGIGYDFQQAYGKKVYQVSQVIDAVYNGSGKEWKMVMGVQLAGRNGNFTTSRFRAPDFSSGDTALYPINSCDIIAPAGYFSPMFGDSGYPGYIDAIYNYKQGGSLREDAFDWYADEFRNNSTAPGYTDNPFTIEGLYYTPEAGETYAMMPFWVHQASLYGGRTGNGVEVHEYEGGQTIVGPNNIEVGFPATHVGSGTTITANDVDNFLAAFLESSQFAQVVVDRAQASIDAGVKFPSQFQLTGPWTHTGNWGLYRANENFLTGSATLAYSALLEWNGGNAFTLNWAS